MTQPIIQITIENLIGFLTLALFGATALCGVWWKLAVADADNAKNISAALQKASDELNAFKLQVSKEYASADGLKESEDRLTSALSRLADEFRELRTVLINQHK
jgi:hypothetical protein